MNNTHELAKRFQEVFLNGTWIANTNYRQQLEGVSRDVATATVGSLNTIAALAQHMHYYINGVKRVLQGGTLDIKDQFSFDFPPMESQATWESFRSRFADDAAEFAALIEQMPEDQLDAVFVDERYGTYRRNIDGLIEHGYYHLGQITLLKKLLQGGV